MKTYTKILSIAGSDSSAGAGIQADIKTISALGAYATTAITAVTVQNTEGVQAIHPIPADIVEQEIVAVLSDLGTDAIKIGMLHNAKIIRSVCDALHQFPSCPVVLDPIMLSSSGKALLASDAIEVMKSELLPLVSLLTPNIPEAEALLGYTIKADEMKNAAYALAEMFSCSVYLKGGHREGNIITDICCDITTESFIELPSDFIASDNKHGTGCTLSAALATFLGQGRSLEEAASLAKSYIDQAIEAGKDYKIGKGNGPLNHFMF